MADTPETQAAPEANQGQMQIQKIYIKDVSFEAPHSPSIFLEQPSSPPEVDFKLNTKPEKLRENDYEVAIEATVTVKFQDKVAFLVEVHQAGIFTLSGFDDQQLSYMIGSYCPSALYPYLRETVSDLVIRGGFPPLLLEPVNFDAMYAQKIHQAAQKQAEAGANPTVN